MRPALLAWLASGCLAGFALLAVVVAHGTQAYGFEDPIINGLADPATTPRWADLSEILATPVIAVVLVTSVIVGAIKRVLLRVAVYAALAVLAFLVSEHIAKPLVHRSFYAEVTFPSGSVTAVCATALATWLAHSAWLGRRGRNVVLFFYGAWTILIALAVVAALWHTPLDSLGSVLLSVGVVAGGGAIFERALRRGRGPGPLA